MQYFIGMTGPQTFTVRIYKSYITTDIIWYHLSDLNHVCTEGLLAGIRERFIAVILARDGEQTRFL